MKHVPDGALQLELKYCERCGGLWLRPKGSDLIFCANCAKAMAGIAPLWLREQRPRQHRSGEGKHESAAFWGEGGNA